MKEEAFFRQASQDPVFRRLKIEELAYHCRFTKICVIGFAILLGGLDAYRSISESRWMFSLNSGWFSVFLGMIVFTSCFTRLAALRAMDAQEPVSPPCASERLAN